MRSVTTYGLTIFIAAALVACEGTFDSPAESAGPEQGIEALEASGTYVGDPGPRRPGGASGASGSGAPGQAAGLGAAVAGLEAQSAARSTFTDRAAFVAAAPGLAVEDFERTNVPPGTALGCVGPFDSSTDNDCFSPDSIQDGIAIESVEFTHLAVLRPPVRDVESTVVGPASIGDAADLTFAGADVNAVGMDLLAPMGGPGPVDIEMFDTDGNSLGIESAWAGSTEGVFWGVISDVPLGGLRLLPEGGVDADEPIGVLFDDVAFGGAAGDPAVEVVVQVRTTAVNPSVQGVIPVAVLSTEAFDARSLDPGTVRFGPDEAASRDGITGAGDLDGDGLADALFQFPTAATGLACGDTSARLVGLTDGGVEVEGAAEVRVLCRPDPPVRRGRGSGG